MSGPEHDRSKPRRPRLSRRNRVVYPRDGRPISASQTASVIYKRPAPLPPRTIRLTVRIEVREDWPGPRWGMVSSPHSFQDLPLPWKLRDFLWTAIKSAGPDPAIDRQVAEGQQFDVHVDQLEFEPRIEPDISMDELGRLWDTIYWALSGALTSLWGGSVVHWQHHRFVETPNPGREWYVGNANGAVLGNGYPTRAVAEKAIKEGDRAEGFRAVEARDVLSVREAFQALSEPPELRHGQETLTPDEAHAVQPGDLIFHLGCGRLTCALGVVPDGPGAPLFQTEHGMETYTLFRLPRASDAR